MKLQKDETSGHGRVVPNTRVSFKSSKVKFASRNLQDSGTKPPYRRIPISPQISKAAALLRNQLQSLTRLPAKISLVALWPCVWCLPVRLLQTPLRRASHSRDDPVIGGRCRGRGWHAGVTAQQLLPPSAGYSLRRWWMTRTCFCRHRRPTQRLYCWTLTNKARTRGPIQQNSCSRSTQNKARIKNVWEESDIFLYF